LATFFSVATDCKDVERKIERVSVAFASTQLHTMMDAVTNGSYAS